MAAASMNRAGKLNDIEARASSPSVFKRLAHYSSTLRGNSGSSSRNKRPLCASDTSPAVEWPRRQSARVEMVWCGARTAAASQSAAASRTPATEWILVVPALLQKSAAQDRRQSLGQHRLARPAARSSECCGCPPQLLRGRAWRLLSAHIFEIDREMLQLAEQCLGRHAHGSL